MNVDCKQCGKGFIVDEWEQNFLKKVCSPVGAVQFEIPVPDLCPLCRKMIRLSHRNHMNLFKRKCDFCSSGMISFYPLSYKGPVYCNVCWYGDGWDPLSSGRDFDFSRPFFEQFFEMVQKVPMLGRSVVQSENCDYINGAGNCRNCYLSHVMDYCEDCYYIYCGIKCRSCVDCFRILNCELCYELVNAEDCYLVHYSQRAINCRESYFLYGCRNVENCIGCVNLVGKKYHIFNQPVSKEEFERYKEAFKSRKYVKEFQKKFDEFSLQFPRKYYSGVNNEDFTGDCISNSKSAFSCFECVNVEECRYCYFVFDSHHCMDYDIYGDQSAWIYNCLATGYRATNNICSVGCWKASSNNYYCYFVCGAVDNFGCSGIQQKQYCILNTQYTQEEYEELVPRIVEHMKGTGEWGRFFPQQYAPFGYQLTVANEMYPLGKSEVLRRGYCWDENPQTTQGGADSSILPDFIDDVSDDILNKPLICSETGKSYKIIDQELRLYRQFGVSVPDVSHYVRMRNRFERDLPQKLHDRNCMKCEKFMSTAYAPDGPEIVYCDECYLNSLN